MNDEVIVSDGMTFEDFKNENGITFWWASDFLQMLGYPNMKAFEKVISRATKAFASLNINLFDNIIRDKRTIGDKTEDDYKLTRFACYMCAMNGDVKKPEVAMAQAYFAEQTRKYELFIEDNQNIDRLLTREELTEGNKSLASTVKQEGVNDYAKFTNAGYLGMYNMASWQLEKKRNIKKGKLMDYMGRTELAANLFRVTQTEERIKSQNIKGQANLEQTHKEVGKEVRAIIVKNTGRTPEQLPQEKQLPEVKKELKVGYKNMTKEDKKPKK